MVSAANPIAPSEYTRSIKPIEQGATALITPASGSFNAAVAANPTKRDFLVQAGDYRAWAEETLTGLHGTAERPYVFRYEGPNAGVHPVRRNDHAIVHPLHLENSEHLTFQGLTCRDHGTSWVSEANPFYGPATNIIYDRLLCEGQVQPYTFRVFSSNITVQNTVVRNAFKSTSDTVAIQVKPFQNVAIENVHILNMEVYNCKDSIGFTQSGTDQLVRVTGVVVDNADFYNTSDYFGWTENAIDVKTRPRDGERNLIRRVRAWGHWPTSAEAGATAAGDVIVFHQVSANYDVEDCIFGESISGIRDEVYSSPYNQQFTTRGLAVRRCYFYKIQGGGHFNAGAIDLIHSAAIDDNHFVGCRYILGAPITSGYRDGGPTFNRNVRINCPNLRAIGGTAGDNVAVPFRQGLNYRAVPRAPYTYWRKQWTGPEQVSISNAARFTPDHAERHVTSGITKRRG